MRYPGQRWVRIALRTLHIASAAMVIGAAMHDGGFGPWPDLLALSGLAIVADDLYKGGLDWIRYLHAWVVITKVGLAVWGAFHHEHLMVCLFAALILGSVISHAPGKVRQFAFWGEPGPCARKNPPDRAASPT